MKQVVWGVVIALVIGLLVVVGMLSDKPGIWTPTYERTDDKPLGSAIVFEHLRRTAQVGVDVVDRWPSSLGDTAVYVVITPRWDAGDDTLNALFDWVDGGGTLFVATEGLSESVSAMIEAHGQHVWHAESVRFVDGTSIGGQTFFDSLPAPVRSRLAFSTDVDGMYDTIAVDELQQPVMLRRSIGAGTLILCSMPRVLTNYGLLHAPSKRLSETFLDRIDRRRPIVWDEVFKHPSMRSRTPGRSGVLSQYPPLRWAFGLCVVGALLYVFVYSRRIQRPIPLIEPEKNTSADFVDTVAAAHEARQDAGAMVDVMIHLFFDHVTRQLRIDRIESDDALAAAVAVAGGGSADACRAVLRQIERLRQSETITDDDMVDFHQSLQTYYRSVPQ